jgi:hypothetical protein
LQAENQIRFYEDVMGVLRNATVEKIIDLEMKYGTYEEISQGIQIDHNLYRSALISELKRRIASKLFC